MQKTILVLLLSIFLFSPTVIGWSITPAKWTFYQKEDYEIYPLTFDMEIKNDDSEPITVELTIIEPNYLYPDNEPIPDRSWIQLGESEIEVPGSSTGIFPVYIDIPESYKKNGESISNYNKSYETWIHASQTGGAGNIRIDYNCRWTIQTPERYVPPEERPDYVNPFYTIIPIIIIVVFSILGFVFYRKKTSRRKKPKSKKPKSKRKSVEETEDDIFG
jgi:hypothetical protein